MWWSRDDIVDKLIANNTARPIPGMEKPDMSKSQRQGSALRSSQSASRLSPDLLHERLWARSLETPAA